jgi:hypothetical protein
MTLKTLQKFREAAYKLLGTGKDAVMDLMDAVLVYFKDLFVQLTVF